MNLLQDSINLELLISSRKEETQCETTNNVTSVYFPIDKCKEIYRGGLYVDCSGGVSCTSGFTTG